MKLKIGTRKSKLALWQANLVRDLLAAIGVDCEIVKIESFGDKVQDVPLHKLGDKGVFTKALDEALFNGTIDLAVHSLKDVPTELEDGLVLASVPVREDPRDALVKNPNTTLAETSKIIATGSIRRRAFVLNKYPDFEVSDLRGNVPTRIKKVEHSNWKGAVFAYAGLKRLELDYYIAEFLDWMLPAPAQGAVGIVCRDEFGMTQTLKKIEDTEARKCVDTEREFLNTLEAGCSSPVGALAQIRDNTIYFRGAVLSINGTDKIEIEDSITLAKFNAGWGVELAHKLINLGALALIKTSKNR